MSGTTKNILLSAGVLLLLAGVYVVARRSKNGTIYNPLTALTTDGPKTYLKSGAYVQGQTVFAPSGAVVGSGIKQINTQGNVYFNNGSILYDTGGFIRQPGFICKEREKRIVNGGLWE